jgi:hypothetical protein
MTWHFGRLVIVLMSTAAGPGLLLRHAVGSGVFTRLVAVLYVVGSVAGLLTLERRRGSRPGAFTITATVPAATASAWVLLESEARWRAEWLLLVVLVTPVMSVSSARPRTWTDPNPRPTTPSRRVTPGPAWPRIP